MDKATTLHLLDNVNAIRKKYDEIAKITGENFNIFSVLNLQTDEVYLHSKLIGEVLNPRGSHNQKGVFLKLFLQILGIDNEYIEQDINNAQVIVEEYIGNISDDYDKGGRIDLVIKFHTGKPIVIENKIWAKDQPKQLWRYKQEYKNAHIIYLTPDGEAPSKDSLNGINESEIKCISYRSEIKIWITNCVKEVPNLPLIREILNHYLNTINQITNQARNKKMEDELINEIVKDFKRIEATEYIVNNYNKILFELMKIIGKNLEDNNTTGLRFKGNYDDSKGWVSYDFFIDEKYAINIDCGKAKYDYADIGLYLLKDEYKISEKDKNDIKNKLSKMEVNSETTNAVKIVDYPNWVWVSKLLEWENTTSMNEVITVDFARKLIRYVQRMIDLVNKNVQT